MAKALKVVMIVYGVYGLIFGIGFTFFMPQMSAMMGFEQGPAYVRYIGALMGLTFVAISVFVIMAARDPLSHISWVKFAILWAATGVIGGLYSVIVGYVGLGQAVMGIAGDTVLTAALLICYPWRATSASQEAGSPAN